MALVNRTKVVADSALRKVGEYSGKAGEKGAELSEHARAKAPDYIERAAELAGRAVDATAAGIDKATKGRWHERIDAAHDRIDRTIDDTHASQSAPQPRPTGTGQYGTPVTPATTNPEATKG